MSSTKKYTVTQTRSVQVEASSPLAARNLANKAFYGNRPAKADPPGLVLSVVQVTGVDVREGA